MMHYNICQCVKLMCVTFCLPVGLSLTILHVNKIETKRPLLIIFGLLESTEREISIIGSTLSHLNQTL